MSTTPSDSEYIDQYDTASPKSLWAVAENYTNRYFGITRCSTTDISLVDNTGSNRAERPTHHRNSRATPLR